MQHYDHVLAGVGLALALGAHRRYGPAVAIMAGVAAVVPDWDDLPGGVHRIWGHSLLTAPLAGAFVAALGLLGYLSIFPSRPEKPAGNPREAWIAWILIGMLAALIHIPADLAYSGRHLTAEWPVALFWPISSQRWAYPLVPFPDRGMTAILGTTLATACLLRRWAQLVAVLGLIVATVYVFVWRIVFA